MKDYQAYRIESKYSEIRGIESEAEDMQYFVDGEKQGIAISGAKGITVSSVEQAVILAQELPLILKQEGLVR